MADWSIKRQVGILHDVLVKVDKFIFPIDFVILDCKVDVNVRIILGRSFLAIGRALMDVQREDFKFWVNGEEAVFNTCKTMKQAMDF